MNVNAEENKVLNENNVVVTENEEDKEKDSTVKKTLVKAVDAAKSGVKLAYQLARTGVKYAAIGCCMAFGFYTFKYMRYKTKCMIKNMRKKLKSDSCSSCRSNSDDSSIYSIINVDTNSNSTYQRSSLRNSSFIDRNRYNNNNGGNLKRSVSFGYLALQQNNDFNDEVKSPLIV